MTFEEIAEKYLEWGKFPKTHEWKVKQAVLFGLRKGFELAKKDLDDTTDEHCKCHDPMTQTNAITGESECYYCGLKR